MNSWLAQHSSIRRQFTFFLMTMAQALGFVVATVYMLQNGLNFEFSIMGNLGRSRKIYTSVESNVSSKSSKMPRSNISLPNVVAGSAALGKIGAHATVSQRTTAPKRSYSDATQATGQQQESIYLNLEKLADQLIPIQPGITNMTLDRNENPHLPANLSSAVPAKEMNGFVANKATAAAPIEYDHFPLRSLPETSCSKNTSFDFFNRLARYPKNLSHNDSKLPPPVDYRRIPAFRAGAPISRGARGWPCASSGR